MMQEKIKEIKMAKLKLSFLEREFFAESKDGKHVKGYEPAIIETPEETKVGRVINLKRIKQAQFLDSVLFETELDFVLQDLELSDLLIDEDARKWLEAFRQLHKNYYLQEVSMRFAIKPEPMPFLRYKVYPSEIIKGKKPFEGVVSTLPDSCIFGVIEPPLKLEDGSWISNVYYKRQSFLSNGELSSFSNAKNPKNKSGKRIGFLPQTRATLLGQLENRDIDFIQRGYCSPFPEDVFPIKNFLEISYPISLRDNQHNPLTIKVELLDEKN